MEVCKDCHEKDRDSIGCKKDLADHYPYEKRMINTCMICGRRKSLRLCPAYKGYNVREPERKLKGKKP